MRQALAGLRRGLAIIEILSKWKSGISFSELQAALDDLAPATLSRIIKVLQAEGWVRRDADSGQYVLDERAEALAQRLSTGLPLHERIRPIVRQLAVRSGQTATYWEATDIGPMLMCKKEMEGSIHIRDEMGINPRPCRHAFGQVMMPWIDESWLRTWYDKDPDPMHSFEEVKALLPTIRKEGYLIDLETSDTPWIRAAAALQLPDGNVGSIGIGMLPFKLDNAQTSRIRSLVTQAATQANSQLEQA